MDHRIPTESEEVRIVRALTMKSDAYYIDGKNVTKTEVFYRKVFLLKFSFF